RDRNAEGSRDLDRVRRQRVLHAATSRCVKLASSFRRPIASRPPGPLTACEEAITKCGDGQRRQGDRRVRREWDRVLPIPRAAVMHIHTARPVLFVFSVAAAFGAACKEEAPPAPAPPPEVYVAAVVRKDVPEYLELVGQTEGYQDVEIRARVEGFLETMNYIEG